LTLKRVAFLVVEPPDSSYPWSKADRISIDAGVGQPKQSSSVLPTVPPDTSPAWIYLEELNAFCSSQLETLHSNGRGRRSRDDRLPAANVLDSSAASVLKADQISVLRIQARTR
jgi:hypothetical protein